MKSNKKEYLRQTFISFILLAVIMSVSLPIENFIQKQQKPTRLINASSEINPDLLWKTDLGGIVSSLELSANGDSMAIWLLEKKLYYFETSSSIPVWNNDSVGDGAYMSENGEYLVSGKINEYLYFFKYTDSNPIKTYYPTSAYDIDISGDGQYFVYCGSDSSLYNRTAKVRSYQLESDAYTVDMSNDGNYIVVGSENGKLFLFDRTQSEPIWSFTANAEISSVSISSDGQYIAARSQSNKLYLFNNTNSLWNYTFSETYGSVKISNDGECVVSEAGDTLFLFHISSSNPLWSYKTKDSIHSYDISGDGNYILMGEEYDDGMFFFEKSSSTPIKGFATGMHGVKVEICTDGDYFAVGNRHGDLFLFSTTGGAEDDSDDTDKPFITGYNIILLSTVSLTGIVIVILLKRSTLLKNRE